jgi:hypothetical protein
MGLLRNALSRPQSPPAGLRGRRLCRREYVFRVADVLPAGLPRLTGARLEPASRLVLAYLRVLSLLLGLGIRAAVLSLILGIIAQRLSGLLAPCFQDEIR